jgi:LysR family transcriptional regulator, transcriptional activator of nhaA
MRGDHSGKSEPMKPAFSYHHLYYFWIAAREGGIARGAARLGMAVQTVSAQVRHLERDLGRALFRAEGRGVALTAAGEAALRQADRIFELGGALAGAVRDAERPGATRLAVGISDALPKLVVRRLMEPILHEPRLRLLCHEGEMDELLGDLALHRLDLVLADRAPPPNPNLRLYGHALGSSPLAWYAVAKIHHKASRGFPQSLASVPLLLPTAHWAIRPALDQWLQDRGITPNIAAECEDSALLKAFAAEGMGVVPAADWMRRELLSRYGLRRVGACDGVEESFFAIGTERKVVHPLVRRLLAARR